MFGKIYRIYNEDCITGMQKRIPKNAIDMVLADIPYGEVNRSSGGLRNIDKGVADICTIDLEALFAYLIESSTNEGDPVLDCCMGSGTTAEACINTGRHYIGFELDRDYYKTACERIHPSIGESAGV
ncbi:DNA methylase, N-6 adenine-specific, conserved site [Desulfitobacterium hafniense]|uniref:DNA methylase, N-6 adenine-specific, conserved site n=1 Tax=Desulfitobacterium hafniense TaxID=49338 RepID=A0A098B0Z3_DESHA|nr:DNA methyltransferase [Desulfitobacterium hafniense]CDX01536.1 DNA methylase, N-6 adenine-specific, conserved site [Desulfitobacterium hafniense]